jgi:hypothetical protein
MIAFNVADELDAHERPCLLPVIEKGSTKATMMGGGTMSWAIS